MSVERRGEGVVEWASWESERTKVYVEKDFDGQAWKIYMWIDDKPARYVEIPFDKIVLVQELYDGRGEREAIYIYAVDDMVVVVTAETVLVQRMKK